MTFEEAKTKLKEEYIKIGFLLVDEHKSELYFSFNSKKYIIDEEDIKSYLTFLNNIDDFENNPSECSIVSINYREHIINFQNPRDRIFILGNNPFIFIDEINNNLHVEISRASDDFINYFRFKEQFIEYNFGEPIRFGHRFGNDGNFVSLKESLLRPITIKVYNLKESSIKSAILKSNEIIDACIFSLASLKKRSIELLDEWPLIRRRKKKTSLNFEFGDKIESSKLPIPKFKIDSVLLRFYQQATSTDIPSLKYLAFYQILEYFFLSVSDENLYNNLTRRINDLKFKTTPNHLNKLIQDVISHKRENDETEMLKNVIVKYVDENDLIRFITEYEAFINKKIYTSKRVIFGEDVFANTLKQGHVFGNIAKTIKAVRNALVHSSDRHERNVRYIPYSKEGTEIIETELPLIKFLADKVIIASSTVL